LRELSELTGLSTAAVSYALRGQRVSAQTEARVRAAADEIGFRADPIASALRGGRTHLIGVIGGSLADHWHQEFVAHLGRALRERGLALLLADAGGDPAAELELAENLADRRADGLIVLPLDPSSTRWQAIAETVPTVSVNDALPAPARAIRFATDEGVDLALAHLDELGHERVVVLGDTPHVLPRRSGRRRVRCGRSAGDARAAVLRELTRTPAPTAVFALSDTLAYGAYQACRKLEANIPADISVIGFDDHPISALLDPPLTTVGWDTPAAARAAVAVLVNAIEGRRATHHRPRPPTLHVRGSTGPVS
jgi:LacI family transcriptional regulator